MAENIRKYEENIKNTVKVLSETTSSIESKIKELVLILNAVNQGFLTKEEQIKAALEGVSKGKFESRTLLKQYLKDLDVADDALDKIVDQYIALEQKTLAQVKLTEDYIKLERELHIKLDERIEQQEDLEDLQEEENDLLEKKIDLVSDLVKKYQEFSSNIASNQSTLKNLNIDLTSTSSGLTSFLNNASDVIPNLFKFDDTGLKKYSAQIDSIGKSLKSGESLVKLPGETENIEIDVAFTNIEKLISKIKPQIDSEMKYRTELFNKYINHAMGLDAEAALQKADQLNEMASKLENLTNLEKDELDLLNSQLRTLSVQDQLFLGQYVSSKKILDTNLEDLKTTEAKLKQLERANEISDSYDKKIQQIGITLRNTIDYIPFGLQRMLGIDALDQQISGALTKSIKAFNTNIAMGENRMMAAAKAAKAFGTSFATMLGPIGLIAAAIGAIGLLVKSVEGNISNISKEFGVSRGTAKQINLINKEILASSENRFATEEQLNAIQKEYLESNGQLLDLTKKNNQDLVQTAVLAEQAYGIMNSEAMSVMSTLKSLGADDSLAQQLLADIGYMAELAGMSPNVIAKDMVEGANELSLYFGGMPKQAAKAAIQIRRMGMSIKQAGQIADKMLNIESFMTDMTELSAMTSGRLNLSEAFDLRMQGDIVGMTESVMNNIGSLQQFNSESEFVQRKLAATLGMEVTDLRKSLKLREMQTQLGEANAKLLQDNLDKVGDIENMSVENMKAKAEELNSTKQLGVALAKIKSVLYKALVPIAETFSELLASSTGIIDAIGIGFKVIGGIIKLISPVVQGFIAPFKWLGDVISFIVKKLDSLFGSSKTSEIAIAGMNVGLSNTTSILTDIGKAIGIAFGSNYIIKALTGFNLLGKSMSMLKGSSVDAGEAIVKNLTKPSLFKTIADKFKSIEIIKPLTDSVKSKLPVLTSLFDKLNPFKKLQDKATVVDLTKPMVDNVEKSKGLLGKLFDKINPIKKVQEVSTNVDVTKTLTESTRIDMSASKLPDVNIDAPIEKTKGMVEKISGLVKQAGDLIKNGLSTLKSLVIGIVETIAEALTTIGSGIGKFLEGVLTGLSNGLNKFQPKALIGAAALTIVAAALWVTSKAMENFNNVNWDSLAKAGVAIAGLGLVAAAFGGLSTLILAGSIAMTAASGALWIFGKALGSIGDVVVKIQPIVETFMTGLNNIASTVMSNVNSLFTTLSGIDATQLLAMGPALIGIAAGLAAISAGSILKGLTSLFTADPFAKLEKVALLADPMNIVANSVKLLADGITQLSSVLNSMDIDKLGKLSDNSIEVRKTLMTEPTKLNVIPQQDVRVNTVSNTTPVIQPAEPNTIIQNNSSSTQSTIEKQQSISTLKMERLLAEIRDLLNVYAQRPIVLGVEGAKSLNHTLKGLNNR